MASGDIITRLVLDHSKHDSGLQQSKRALQNYANSAGSVDGVVKNLIQTFGKYVSVSAAVTTALKVGKDAFFANESNVDSWGRTLEAAKGIYNGFLNALNSGDVSGFVSRIDEIVAAAKKAYDSLDELQTKATIIAPSQAKAQALITQQKEIIRKKGKDSEEGKAAQKRIQELEPQLKAGYKETADLNRQYFIDAVKAKAKEAGITLTNEMWRSFTDTKAFDAISARAKGSAAHDVWQSADGYGSYKEHFDDTRNAEKRFLDAFTDEFRREISPYLSAEWSARGSSYSVGIADARYTSNTSSGGKGGKGGNINSIKSSLSLLKGDASGLSFDTIPEGSIAEMEQMLKDAEEVYKMAGDNTGRAYAKSIVEALKRELEYRKGNNPLADLSQSWKIEGVDFGNGKGALPDMPDTVKQAKDTASSWRDAASAMRSVGGALSQMGDKGLNVAGIIMQAVANVALGFSSALAQSKSGKLSVWAWIAEAAAGAATMVSTIAAIKSATSGSYANGGVIGGNSYSGDRLYAKVNSGETILNASQAQTALDMMDSNGNGGGGGSLQPYCNSETIYMGLNAWGKRTGRGELVFARR